MSRKIIKVSAEELQKEKENKRKELSAKVLKYASLLAVLLIVPIVSYFIMEFMIRNPFAKMKWNIQVLNMCFWELLMLVLFFAYGSIRAAARTELIVAYLIGLLDYFVISFRSTPVQPWDIYSIKVAASVADGYSYTLKGKVVFLGILTIILCILVHWVKYKIDRKNKVRLIVSLVCLLVSLCSMYGYIKYVQQDSTVKKYSIYDKLFTPTTMTYKDGTILAFLMECKYLKVEKPQGYSDKKAVAKISEYSGQSDFEDTKVLWKGSDEDTGEAVSDITSAKVSDITPAKVSEQSPNIIVIMDEAFSDLSVLQDYTTNMDEIPFVRSMLAGADNTVSGYLDVSVLGGNTANTEFEFLTGNTMAWLPQGSVPYQQYIKEEKETMASVLKNQGYDTIAMHPYKATGWDRNIAYKLFGFDEFYSITDYEDSEIIRKYVSDWSDFQKIKEVLKNKDAGQAAFIFNVTMQNHSSYTDNYDNFAVNVEIEGVDKFATRQYLSLLKRTDSALEDFIGDIADYDEPTIVVFFGDHQPTDSVVSPLYKNNGNSVASLTDEEQRDRYKVPFFIWANYDIEEETGVVSSPNFLGARTMDIAGVKTSSYEEFLLDINKKYASINTLGVTYQTGEVKSVEEAAEELADYRLLQYYMLFK